MDELDISKNINEEKASLLSQFFLLWVNPLIQKGKKNTIEQKDILPLPINENFAKYTEILLQKIREFSGKKLAILKILLALRKKLLLTSMIASFISLIITLVQPLLIREVIFHFEQQTATKLALISYGAILFILSIVNAVASQYSINILFKLGRIFRGAVMFAIGNQVKSATKKSLAQSNMGNITNLLTIDSDIIVNSGIININFLWSLPIKIIVLILFLYSYLGLPALAGAIVLVASIPLSNHFIKKSSFKRKEWQNIADTKTEWLRKIIKAIKVIKIRALEQTYSDKIESLKEVEITKLKEIAKAYSLWFLLANSSVILASIVTFTTYQLYCGKLVTVDIFFALALFGMLLPSVTTLITVLRGLVDSHASFNRITGFFLQSDTYIPYPDNQKISTNIAIKVNQAIFKMVNTVEQDAIYSALNLNIKKQELVVILGNVGAGKSILLECLTGQIDKIRGELVIDGRIAYMPQKPWTINDSIKNNILMGRDISNGFYKAVITNTHLAEDFNHLPQGDLSNTGEDGCLLSGGQKQRISLARTILSEADIYLLDDPLSAVDKETAHKIIEDTILKHLADKTRIIVTNNSKLIKKANKIIVLQDRKLHVYNSYEEILQDKRTSTLLNKVEDIKIVEHEDNIKNEKRDSVYTADDKSKTAKVDEGKTKIAKQIFLQRFYEYLNIISKSASIIFIASFITREIFRVVSDLWLLNWTKINAVSDLSFIITYTTLAFMTIGNTFICSMLNYHNGLKITRLLHHEIFSALLRAPISFYNTVTTGTIFQKITKDTHTLDVKIPELLLDCLSNVFMTVSVLCVILLTKIQAAILIIFPGYFYFKIREKYIHSSREIRNIEPRLQASVLSVAKEIYDGNIVINTNNLHYFFHNKFKEKVFFYMSSLYTWLALNRWLALRLELIAVALLGIVVSLGVVAYSHISPAIFGLALTYTFLVSNSLKLTVRLTAQLENSLQSVSHIKEFVKGIPQEPKNQKVLPIGWLRKGAVEIKDLTIQYPKSPYPTIENISLKIKAGEKIGIIGRTGAGKSTFLSAIFRIIQDYNGSISIDGQDIAELNVTTLRNEITYLTQETTLLPGTLRFNLDPNNKFSNEELYEAVAKVGLTKTIADISSFLDNEIDIDSVLSLGQKQQVCLAQAILKNSKLILLDEATATMDNQTDRLIQNILNKQFNDSTIITVAHRLETIMNYDRIYKIVNGKLTEVKLSYGS